eukprot:SAG22_NODE_1226_length_5115_cov_1.930024_1_plen_507_part_00
MEDSNPLQEGLASSSAAAAAAPPLAAGEDGCAAGEGPAEAGTQAATSALRLGYAFHASLCLGFFGLGVVLCMLGPTLLDLGQQTGSTVQEMSYVFTARSGAYLVGSVVGGLLLDRLENTSIMLAAAMYLVALGSSGIPLCTEVWSMGCFMACAGIAMGLLDTGANVVTLRLWGKKSEPFMQSLHASFAVGALVAPLLAEQFITHGRHAAAVAAACAGDGKEAAELAGGGALEGELLEPVGEGGAPGEQHSLVWAFWMSGIFVLPAAVGLTLLAPGFPALARSNVGGDQAGAAAAGEGGGEDASAEDGDGGGGASVHHPRLLLGLGLLIFALYVGAEIGYGGYVFSYAVASCGLRFDESDAAYLTAVYWGFFTAGRVLAIPLSVVASPRTLTAIDVAGCLVSALAMYSWPDSPAVLWVGTAAFGLSLASVFPSTFTMLERMLPLDGAAASVIMVGSAGGEMLMPLLIGTLFDRPDYGGPDSFPAVVAAVGVFGAGVFLVLLKLAGSS